MIYTGAFPSRRRAALPLHLPPQPFVERDPGLPAGMALQLGRVGEGVALVAGAGRFLAGFRLAAGDGLDLAENVPDVGGLAAAEIVDFADRTLHGPHRGVHTIVDVGVAADLLAVAVDNQFLSLHYGFDELVITHVGPLPRA